MVLASDTAGTSPLPTIGTQLSPQSVITSAVRWSLRPALSWRENPLAYARCSSGMSEEYDQKPRRIFQRRGSLRASNAGAYEVRPRNVPLTRQFPRTSPGAGRRRGSVGSLAEGGRTIIGKGQSGTDG
jgi:hypothetical protein